MPIRIFWVFWKMCVWPRGGLVSATLSYTATIRGKGGWGGGLPHEGGDVNQTSICWDILNSVPSFLPIECSVPQCPPMSLVYLYPADCIFSRSTLWKHSEFPLTGDALPHFPAQNSLNTNSNQVRLWHIHINMTAHMTGLRWDPLDIGSLVRYNTCPLIKSPACCRNQK